MFDHHHVSSWIVGTTTGAASIAIPDEVTTWLGKFMLGLAVALVSGLVHGLAKRWAGGKGAK
jgi:hypothetical protein